MLWVVQCEGKMLSYTKKTSWEVSGESFIAIAQGRISNIIYIIERSLRV